MPPSTPLSTYLVVGALRLARTVVAGVHEVDVSDAHR
jgi:hypothetical protein